MSTSCPYECSVHSGCIRAQAVARNLVLYGSEDFPGVKRAEELTGSPSGGGWDDYAREAAQ